MKKNYNKISSYLSFIFISYLVIGGLFLTINYFQNTDNGTDFSQSNIIDLKKHIQDIEMNDQQAIVHFKIPDTDELAPWLVFHTEYEEVQVFQAGKMIYDYTSENLYTKSKTLGSSWHLVSIPRNISEDTLTIKLINPYQKINLKTIPFFMGEKGSIIMFLLYQYGIGFLFSCFILLVGVFTIITHLIVSKMLDKDKTVLYLGIYLILSSLWCLGESTILDFLIPNQIWIHNLIFITLTVIPSSTLFLAKELFQHPNKASYNRLIILNLCITILIFTLQLLGIADFAQTIFLTHLSLGVSVSFILVTSIKCIREKSYISKATFFGLLSMIMGSGFDVRRYYQGDYIDSAVYTRWGIIIFTIMIFYDCSQKIYQIAVEQVKLKVLYQIAYIDELTGVLNRSSFKKTVESLATHHTDNGMITIIMVDLNGLKRVNDTLGHDAGDQLIILAAQFLKKYFENIGDVYRMGGDEFVVIASNHESPVLKQKVEQVEQAIIEQNINYQGTLLSFAIGLAHYDHTLDVDLYATLSRSDAEMYKHKKMTK